MTGPTSGKNNQTRVAEQEPGVVILSGVRGDTRRYRTLHPYEQLRLAGLPCSLSHVTDPKLPRLIQAAQIVIFHRVSSDRYIDTLIAGLHSRGGLALLDADDLTFDPGAFQWIDSPDFKDPVRSALYQEDLRRNHRTLELCDAVITSTRFLADIALAQGKPAWVHPNAFSLEMLGLSERAFQAGGRDPSRVILGYASGTPTHDRDFDLVRPALQATLARFPQSELWLVGPLDAGPGWEAYGSRVRRLPRVPWRELPGLLAQFDINLAPLVTDNPFAQSKSEIKFVEAGLVRVPTVASPTSAFMEAMRPGETGFLAANAQEWETTLDVLVREAGVRERVGRQAYTDVLERYHPCARAPQLVDTINQIYTRLSGTPLWAEDASRLAVAQENIPTSLLDAGVEAHPTLGEMAFYTLRKRGLMTLLKQEWIYFRRLVVPIFPYASGANQKPAGEERA